MKLYDEAIETSVLNSMLNSYEALVIGLTHFPEDSFQGGMTSELFGIIKKLVKQNIKIDRNNINAEYKNNDMLIPNKFMELSDVDINDFKIKTGLIIDYYKMRKMNRTITELKEFDIWTYKKQAIELSNKLIDITKGTTNEVLEEWMVRNVIINQVKNGEKRNVIKTGFWKLDDLITGFGEGNVITIAGRPATCKTAFSTQLAMNNKKDGHIIGYLSLEMSNEEIVERMLCNELKISYGDVRARNIKIEVLDRYNDNFDENIKMIKNQSVRINSLEPLIRTLVVVNNCQIIYIDHLEKLYDNEANFKKHERIGYIMDKLKTIAQELKIPIVVMQQINRGSEDNKESRPSLVNLKSSGSIEEWSDIVMLLHRPEKYHPEDQSLKGLFEVNVAKNRFGAEGIIEFIFDSEYMNFELKKGYSEF